MAKMKKKVNFEEDHMLTEQDKKQFEAFIETESEIRVIKSTKELLGVGKERLVINGKVVARFVDGAIEEISVQG
jgi:hypothetical protein